MKVQYCSDLHLEFEGNSKFLSLNPLRISGDVLILAGDITLLHDSYLNHPFFSLISEKYKKVFWIPGNHEYYHSDLMQFEMPLRRSIFKNIQIVNNVVEFYEDVRFIFSTLWSEIPVGFSKVVETMVSDFHCISLNDKKIKVDDFNRLHSESKKFIQDTLVVKYPKTVIVTHHLPSGNCNSQQHRKSPINSAFCTELSDLVAQSEANFWIYGHSHYNCKPLILGKTFLLTNQLGYVEQNEHLSFKQDAYFAL